MRIPRWLSRFVDSAGSGDLALIEAVSEHVRKWVGEFTVLHEKKSTTVHVDIYAVPPSQERPFHSLVTSGMAQRAMHAPEGAEECTHAELVMFLPPDWAMDQVQTDPRAYWPIKLLHLLARYPHERDAWLWFGHSMPLGDLGTPGVRFDSLVLCEPLLLDPEEDCLVMEDGRTISFFAVALLYPEELELKVEEGFKRFVELAEERSMVEDLLIVNLRRASLAG